ncbi:MAG: hypothetical protein HQK89_04820 [Nitrospirae bacterium]|nr:hypothetical protein [Nitrospirota bacterium]
MCIVIDTNSLSSVFDQKNKDHSNFKAVLKWIVEGKGKIVYGGTTYKDELEKANTFRTLFKEFNKVNKVVIVDKDAVDNKENEYSAFKTNDFDDPHIVAIIAVSGVKLVCTQDKRSIPFITNKQFYKKGEYPKVYSSKRNAKKLLCDSNIADCCKPATRLSKSSCKSFGLD